MSGWNITLIWFLQAFIYVILWDSVVKKHYCRGEHNTIYLLDKLSCLANNQEYSGMMYTGFVRCLNS